MHGRLLIASILIAPLAACAQPAETLNDCIAQFRKDLPAFPKVTPETFDTYTRNAQDLRPVIDNATRSQPEFELPVWDYLARRTDPQRVAQGVELLKRESEALNGIQKRNGVDAATTVAVFGVETDYGRVKGAYPVVDATLSRACLNKKSSERKEHFFTALWLLQEGVVQPDDFRGSWAGAFGMTQFMPGTFVRFMSDSEDAPKADIIHSVPDALATTARYLRGLGWIDGVPWAVEVRVPPAVAKQWNALESEHGCLAQATPSGKCKAVAQWVVDGVTRIDGSSLVKPDAPVNRLDPATNAALMMPAGAQGPAWLATPNYQAIWRYNRADSYALAIGLLSDSLRGGPTQKTPWPTDDGGISRAEFRELQALLLRRGHCDVTVDGATGPRTSGAIREEERRLGWAETGRGGEKILRTLRTEQAPAGDCAESAPAATPAQAASSATVRSASASAPTPTSTPVAASAPPPASTPTPEPAKTPSPPAAAASARAPQPTPMPYPPEPNPTK
jgi:lytic murein transglycosylase